MCNDGVVRRLQPDVEMVLNQMAAMNLPTLDSMPVDEARAFYAQMSTTRPPGPDVGEIVDGVLPGATGDLAYRLYRPPTPGPHPIVVFFHGGGWVVGDAVSDDPLCRDLCVRSDAIVISADYRHAPEHRFPAAVDDAMAAVRWVADNAEALGGMTGTARGVRLERGRQSRGSGLPAHPGRGWTTHRRAGIADAANRRRPDTRLLRRECGRLRSHDRAGPVVLRPLHRPGRPTAIPVSRPCARAICPGCRLRSW